MDIPTSIKLGQNRVNIRDFFGVSEEPKPRRVIKIKKTPASERAPVKTIREFKEWKKAQETKVAKPKSVEERVKELPEDVEGVVKKYLGLKQASGKEIAKAKEELDTEISFVRNEKHYPFKTFMKALITFGLDIRAGKDLESMQWPLNDMIMEYQYDEPDSYMADELFKTLKKITPKLNKALSYESHFYWEEEVAKRKGFKEKAEQAKDYIEQVLEDQYDAEESDSEDEENEEESAEERKERIIQKKLDSMVFHFPVIVLEKRDPYWKSSDFVDEMPVLRELAK